MSMQDDFFSEFQELGWEQVGGVGITRKTICMQHPDASYKTTLYLGKRGSIRFGRIYSESIPISRKDPAMVTKRLLSIKWEV